MFMMLYDKLPPFLSYNEQEVALQIKAATQTWWWIS